MKDREELRLKFSNLLIEYWNSQSGISNTPDLCADVAIQYAIDVLDVLRENEWKNLDNPHFMPHREMDNKIKELKSLLKP